MSVSQCRTSWSQAPSLAYVPVLLHFLEISYDTEFLCVTPARQLTLALCAGCCTPVVCLAVWQLCPFLKNTISGFITIGEEAKLGEAKSKELLECLQMHYCCKRELFPCQSFFLLFLRTECLVFILLNISKKPPFATRIYHLYFPPCIAFKSLYLDFVVWHKFIYLLVYLQSYAIKQPATTPING